MSNQLSSKKGFTMTIRMGCCCRLSTVISWAPPYLRAKISELGVMRSVYPPLLLLLLLGFSFSELAAQKIFSVDHESRADIKVFVVDYESRADLLVFKQDYESRAEGNEGHWCFVDFESRADKKIFFVDYESRADLKVFFVDYESRAGWRNTSKKHWLY